MAVEHQRRPASGSGKTAHGIGPSLLDMLDRRVEAGGFQGDPEVLGCLQLVTRWAWYRHQVASGGHQPVPVDCIDDSLENIGGHFLHSLNLGRTSRPNTSSCLSRSSPQISSMIWVQPASRYSVIASMQS